LEDKKLNKYGKSLRQLQEEKHSINKYKITLLAEQKIIDNQIEELEMIKNTPIEQKQKLIQLSNVILHEIERCNFN